MSDQVVGIALHLLALLGMVVILLGALGEEKRSIADYHRVRDGADRRSTA